MHEYANGKLSIRGLLIASNKHKSRYFSPPKSKIKIKIEFA